jgi:hypothetical protein
MAADLAGTPTPGLWVQLRGETHLANFGAFASSERRLVSDIDVNDFGETPARSVRVGREAAGRERGRAIAVPAGCPAIAVAGGAAYLFGGDRDFSPADVVHEFGPATGVARVTGHLPGRNRHASVLNLNGTVLVAGGRDNDGALPGCYHDHRRSPFLG